MAAEQKAVGIMAREVSRERRNHLETEREGHSVVTDHADHSLTATKRDRSREKGDLSQAREEVSQMREGHSVETDHADHSQETTKRDRSQEKENHSQAREEVSQMREGHSVETDHADHSQETTKRDRSQEKENLFQEREEASAENLASETQPRRVSTEVKTLISSATRKKAASTE